MVERSSPNREVLGSNPGLGIVLVGYGCITHVVVPRRLDGALNRGQVCVRMHLRSCQGGEQSAKKSTENYAQTRDKNK